MTFVPTTQLSLQTCNGGNVKMYSRKSHIIICTYVMYASEEERTETIECDLDGIGKTF